jgi:membrane protease YdiL (CAAX protease family)
LPEEYKSIRKNEKFQAGIILYSIPLIMTVLWYFGRVDFFNENLTEVFPGGDLSSLYPFFYFSLSCVFLRTIIPALIIRFVFRSRLSDFGYNPKGTFEVWWGYLILFLLVLPFIYFASNLQSFQDKYPLCHEAVVSGKLNFRHFAVYQFFYFMIFVSGESFWRGYMIFGLEKVFGLFAVPIMVIPYCMSHYGKPFPEAMAAIMTGTVLGYLALRHRSYWLGVLVHWFAALFMDFCAIYRKGIEFTY